MKSKSTCKGDMLGASISDAGISSVCLKTVTEAIAANRTGMLDIMGLEGVPVYTKAFSVAVRDLVWWLSVGVPGRTKQYVGYGPAGFNTETRRPGCEKVTIARKRGSGPDLWSQWLFMRSSCMGQFPFPQPTPLKPTTLF